MAALGMTGFTDCWHAWCRGKSRSLEQRRGGKKVFLHPQASLSFTKNPPHMSLCSDCTCGARCSQSPKDHLGTGAGGGQQGEFFDGGAELVETEPAFSPGLTLCSHLLVPPTALPSQNASLHPGLTTLSHSQILLALPKLLT